MAHGSTDSRISDGHSGVWNQPRSFVHVHLPDPVAGLALRSNHVFLSWLQARPVTAPALGSFTLSLTSNQELGSEELIFFLYCRAKPLWLRRGREAFIPSFYPLRMEEGNHCLRKGFAPLWRADPCSATNLNTWGRLGPLIPTAVSSPAVGGCVLLLHAEAGDGTASRSLGPTRGPCKLPARGACAHC